MSVRDQLPLALRLYRLASLAAVPTLAPRFLRWRLSRGKENAARLAERYGEASQPRPDQEGAGTSARDDVVDAEFEEVDEKQRRAS